MTGFTFTGADLLRERTRLGMSQTELAYVIEVPVATISRWENGHVGIRHPMILALALSAIPAKRKIRGADAIRGKKHRIPPSPG